jgi:hypothetical protein
MFAVDVCWLMRLVGWEEEEEEGESNGKLTNPRYRGMMCWR